MEQKKRWTEEDMHEGNLFFDHKYPSLRIEFELDYMNSYEEFERFFSNDLMDENLLLGRYLDHLLEEYGTNASKISIVIGKDKTYVGKITSGKEKNPSRDVLLAICVAIGATVEETQILLRYSGKQPLYARRKRDAIVWFALKKRPSRQRMDAKAYLGELNNYLVDHGYPSLSKIIVKK